MLLDLCQELLPRHGGTSNPQVEIQIFNNCTIKHLPNQQCHTQLSTKSSKCSSKNYENRLANNKISHIPDWETTQCEEQCQNFAQSRNTQPKLHATWELWTKLHNVPHWDATQCQKHCQNPALSPHGNLPFTIKLNIKRATYTTTQQYAFRCKNRKQNRTKSNNPIKRYVTPWKLYFRTANGEYKTQNVEVFAQKSPQWSMMPIWNDNEM